MRALLVWLGFLSAIGTSHAAPLEDNMAQRLMACTTCHGRQGRAGPDGYYPRLAGKPAHYLYKQLLDFRNGRRHYGLMANLLEPLTDTYLFEIARHFSELDLPYPPPVQSSAQPQELRRGQQLATLGDPVKKIPACASCHGAALTGVQPDVPGLLGLSRDYLNAQLGGWRDGQRAGHAPDCMASIAKRLEPLDVAALTSWLSTQALPANPKPVTARQLDPKQVFDLSCAKTSLPVGGTYAVADQEPTSVVARGAYLARAGNCMTCHTARGGVPFAGGRRIDTPFGEIYAGNLTPDKQTGLGTWNKDDFWQALHFGKSKGGRLLYPAFPYPSFTLVTRQDADALFVYLQSLPAQSAQNKVHQLRWPYNSQLALAAWRALYFSAGRFESSEGKSAQWNRGAYLVTSLGHCSACHAERNPWGASVNAASLAGGLIPMQNWYAPSLAAVNEAGLAGWRTEDIVALLRHGRSPSAVVSGPMGEVVRGSTQFLSADDLAAMAVYLKDLPQASASSEKPAAATITSGWPTQSGPTLRGAKLYEQHCANCHGGKGQGAPGMYLPLAGNRTVTMDKPVNLVQTVLHGGFAPATAGNPRPYGMPPFLLTLSDSDLAAVLAYVRSSWGNQAKGVSELDIAKIRNLTKP